VDVDTDAADVVVNGDEVVEDVEEGDPELPPDEHATASTASANIHTLV
jgi:hypothetical protein